MEEQVQEAGQMILIDKPIGWTSFDVVKKLKFAGKFKKIGHAGTLDPLATGLLILCTGKMTKQIDSYQAQVKEYTGHFVIGKTTPSVDLETEFDAQFETNLIDKNQLIEAKNKLTGVITQTPPIYSAIKIDGKRAYKSARQGIAVEIKTREVEVSTFEIDDSDFPSISFRIVCSKGTYIRSMVRDFGQLLDNGAYLASLRRTKIGDFDVKNAMTIDQFVSTVSVNKNQD